MTANDIPVFLNGRHCSVPAGSSLRQLLALHDPELLDALTTGAASATDARGLPVDPDLALSAGAIFRVARSARQAGDNVDA